MVSLKYSRIIGLGLGLCFRNGMSASKTFCSFRFLALNNIADALFRSNQHSLKRVSVSGAGGGI